MGRTGMALIQPVGWPPFLRLLSQRTHSPSNPAVATSKGKASKKANGASIVNSHSHSSDAHIIVDRPINEPRHALPLAEHGRYFLVAEGARGPDKKQTRSTELRRGNNIWRAAWHRPSAMMQVSRTHA